MLDVKENGYAYRLINVLYVNNYLMGKEKFLAYEAPQVEIIEVEVEKGFAASINEGEGMTTGFGNI